MMPSRSLLQSRAVLLLAAFCSAGCAAGLPRATPAAQRASLEKAELDFAANVAARGVDAWVEVFAEDGMLLSADMSVVRGHAAIREAMTTTLAKAKIAWHPTQVEVGAGGDMGFTSGPYEITVPVAGGAPRVVSRGRFMTVWKRAPDGTWKVLADMGSEDAGK